MMTMTVNIPECVSKIDDYVRLYSTYNPELLLDTIIAVSGARSRCLKNGDMDMYEKNTLKLLVLKKMIIERMCGGESHE